MTDERTIDSPYARTTAPEAPEEEPATFDTEYVKKLRSEAAARRREAKEGQERITSMEAELVELRESAFRRALADANAAQVRRLADPEDLLTFSDRAALVDDEGKPDPARIAAAIESLITKKPYLAIARGAPTRGVMPGGPPVAPLGLGALVDRAARGEPIDRR
jgi:hypothetical protein